MEVLINLGRRAKRSLREAKAIVLRRLGWLKGDWRSALSEETRFWETALRQQGRYWLPEEYQQRTDPDSELQDYLKALLPLPPNSRVRILDVGAGPLTSLGKRWEGRQVEIVTIDPLAAEYKLLLEKLAIRPPVPTTFGHGERLLEQFEENEFDLAYASNALDHSQDPLAAIEQMIAVVKPLRYVYLWHFANEGIAEAYGGLHQWNFQIQKGDFLIDDGRRALSLTKEFNGIADLACETQTAFGKKVVTAKLKKLGLR